MTKLAFDRLSSRCLQVVGASFKVDEQPIKCRIDQISNQSNVKLIECRTDRMSNWSNVELIECQTDRMSNWSKVELIESCIDQIQIDPLNKNCSYFYFCIFDHVLGLPRPFWINILFVTRKLGSLVAARRAKSASRVPRGSMASFNQFEFNRLSSVKMCEHQFSKWMEFAN